MHAHPPRRRAARRAASLALCVLVAALACEGGERGRPARGAAAEDYFPLVEGAVWVYEVRTAAGSLQVEVKARGEMDLPGGRGRVFVMEERNLGPSLGFVQTAPVGYLVREGYLDRLTGLDFDSAGKLRLLGTEDAAHLLPLDPVPGRTWSQTTRLFEMPEGGGGQLGWSGTVRTRTRIEVPAGAFDDVAEVEIVYQDASPSGPGDRVVYQDYYARGVGLVRSVTVDPSGDQSHTVEQVLRSYRFPR